MNSIKKSMIAFGLILCLAPSSFIKTKASLDDQFYSASKICLCIGGGLVVLGGLTAFFGWLFESDEKMINRTYDRQKKFADHINWLLPIVNPHFFDVSNNYGRTQTITNAREQDLYQVMTGLKQYNQNIGVYFSIVQGELSWLEKQQIYLKKKLATYEKQSSIQQQEEVKELLSMMNELSINALLIRDYCKHHMKYFKLFEAEDKIRGDFAQELPIIQATPVDREYARDVIKKCVHHTGWFNRYPYHEYVKRIDQSLLLVKHALRDAPTYYQERVAWCRWVIDALEYIKAIVVIDPAYIKEIHQQEREALGKVA